jgi:hypothetical protein
MDSTTAGLVTGLGTNLAARIKNLTKAINADYRAQSRARRCAPERRSTTRPPSG